jgi:hypothetical protein
MSQISPFRKYHACFSCCKENVKLFSCGKCRLVGYCSKNCQQAAWNRHKHSCDFLSILSLLSVLPPLKNREAHDEELVYPLYTSFVKILFLLHDITTNNAVEEYINKKITIYPGDRLAIHNQKIPLNPLRWSEEKVNTTKLYAIHFSRLESFLQFFLFLRKDILDYSEKHNIRKIRLYDIYSISSFVSFNWDPIPDPIKEFYTQERDIVDEMSRYSTFMYRFMIQCLNSGTSGSFLFKCKSHVKRTRQYVLQEGTGVTVYQMTATKEISKSYGFAKNSSTLKMVLDSEEIEVVADEKYSRAFLDQAYKTLSLDTRCLLQLQL